LVNDLDIFSISWCDLFFIGKSDLACCKKTKNQVNNYKIST